MKDNTLYWIWLCDRIKKPPVVSKLLECFGDVESIYNCKRSELDGKFANQDINALMDKSMDIAEKIWADTVKAGAFVVTYDSPEYPSLLRQIYDPPYVLYMKGTLFDFDSFIGIGVVGTRHCNASGIKATDNIVRELAKNDFMIISGLALGIDAAAAEAALKEGKPTIAVLGCGIDVVYPPENLDLFERVEECGLIISEYPPGISGSKTSFPRRNRIISGLSRGVIVVQAPKKSGALITSTLATEQGRDVFAVPGDTTQDCCYGSNALIRDGAIPVLSAYDVMKEYPEITDRKPEILRLYKSQKNLTPSEKPTDVKIDISGFTTIQQKIVRTIDKGDNHVDQICHEVGMSNSFTANELLLLEIMGIIKSIPGNRYELKGKI